MRYTQEYCNKLKYSKKDLAFVRDEYNKIKSEATEYAVKDNQTKKQYILRLKEKAVVVFQIEERPMTELSSYMWNELSKYHFTYPESHWSELFKESEKRNYVKSSEGKIHVHQFDRKSPDVEKCECGAINFQSIVYEEKPPEVEEEEQDLVTNANDSQVRQKPDPYSNPITEYIQRVKENLDELGSRCNELLSKYYNDEKTAEIIDQALQKDIKKNTQTQKLLEGRLIHMKKQMDFRQKIGEWEKVKAILLEDTTELLAHVAHCLGITPKHLSNNIIKNKDKYIRNMEFFKSIEVVVPKDLKKGDTFVFDLFSDWYELNRRNQSLKLPLQQLK